MADVRLSAAAGADMRGIAAYTRDHWGTEQALRYVVQLERAFKLLEKMPKVGRQLADLEGEYRKLQVGRHAIFYREDGDGVFVVRVLHERMLPSAHLFDPH